MTIARLDAAARRVRRGARRRPIGTADSRKMRSPQTTGDDDPRPGNLDLPADVLRFAPLGAAGRRTSRRRSHTARATAARSALLVARCRRLCADGATADGTAPCDGDRSLPTEPKGALGAQCSLKGCCYAARRLASYGGTAASVAQPSGLPWSVILFFPLRGPPMIRSPLTAGIVALALAGVLAAGRERPLAAVPRAVGRRRRRRSGAARDAGAPPRTSSGRVDVPGDRLELARRLGRPRLRHQRHQHRPDARRRSPACTSAANGPRLDRAASLDGATTSISRPARSAGRRKCATARRRPRRSI